MKINFKFFRFISYATTAFFSIIIIKISLLHILNITIKNYANQLYEFKNEYLFLLII
jgi:hypothetical protein